MGIAHKPITNHDQYTKVAYRIEQLKKAKPAPVAAIELKLMTELLAEYDIRRLEMSQKQSNFDTTFKTNQNNYF